MFSFALFLQQVLKEGSFSSSRMQQHSKNTVVKLCAYPVPGGLLDMRRDLQYKKRQCKEQNSTAAPGNKGLCTASKGKTNAFLGMG